MCQLYIVERSAIDVTLPHPTGRNDLSIFADPLPFPRCLLSETSFIKTNFLYTILCICHLRLTSCLPFLAICHTKWIGVQSRISARHLTLKGSISQGFLKEKSLIPFSVTTLDNKSFLRRYIHAQICTIHIVCDVRYYI